MKRTAPRGLAVASVVLSGVALVGCGSEEPASTATRPSLERSDEALEEALREPEPFARARRLAALLPTLGAEGVAPVRAALASGDADRGVVETILLLQAWAAHDPEAAAVWAATRTASGYRYAATAPVFERWGRADPQAAAAWLGAQSTLSTQAREAATLGLVRGWYESGRPGLTRFLEGLGAGFEQQRLLGALARRILQRDGSAALRQWAESLPDEPDRFKLAAFRQAGAALARSDLEAARAWCEAHCEGRFGSSLRQLIATHWVAAHDAAAALAWLSTAPAGRERDRAVRVAAQTWLRRHREAAIAWIRPRGPDGVEPWLLPALDLFAVALSLEEPAGAIDWARRIEDDARRRSAYVAIARRWREQDADAAEAWLAESPLSEPARESARQPDPEPRRRRAQPTGEP